MAKKERQVKKNISVRFFIRSTREDFFQRQTVRSSAIRAQGKLGYSRLAVRKRACVYTARHLFQEYEKNYRKLRTADLLENF
jgi:hypothetical protein